MAKLTDFDRYWGEQVIKEYALEGLGANKAQEALKDLGIGRRRQDVLEIYREYAGVPVKAERLKFVRKDYSISQALYTEPVTTRAGNEPFMRKRYRYNVWFTTYNPETKEIRESGTWLASDKPLSRGQIEDEAYTILQGAVEKYNLTVQKFNLAEAQHRRGDAWD